MATAAVAVPEHRLHELPNSRSVEVFDWHITASTNPISNAAECDALHSLLGIPVPEMTFGANFLRLVHRPSSFTYTFSAKDALLAVKRGKLEDGDGGVKVGHAEKWLQSRTDPSLDMMMPETVPTKAYDWTYTTMYPGHQDLDADAGEPHASSQAAPIQWVSADPLIPPHAIPMAELSRQDPILFYAEIPLFEDELHDNGSSALVVRIRVMPTCIFILSRFTLRVDHVLFRTYDTRLYHNFASSPPLIIRESRGWEAPYELVKRHLPKRNDLTPLTDPGFIAQVLAELPPLISQGEGAKTGWRGVGKQNDIAILPVQNTHIGSQDVQPQHDD